MKIIYSLLSCEDVMNDRIRLLLLGESTYAELSWMGDFQLSCWLTGVWKKSWEDQTADVVWYFPSGNRKTPNSS